MKTIFARQGQDKLSLGLDSTDMKTVEKDEDGLPKAWRVFPFGPVSITRDGVTLSGEFTQDDADKIIGHFNKKGEKIPIDANHMLERVADFLKCEEMDISKLTGEKSLAMGFGAFEKRADGLWIKDVEWLPLGSELMKQKVFRHFSPVIRGLKDGNLRITSLSVLNDPAIDNQDAIAASAETRASAAVIVKIKDALGLGAEDNSEALLGALQGIVVKLKAFDAMKADIDKIKLEAEEKTKAELIAQGLKDDKLSNALIEQWAKDQSSVTLSTFLKVAPRIGLSDRIKLPSGNGESGLSEQEQAICGQLSLSAEEFNKAKKLNNKEC